jgi:hypothetical protein
MVAAFEKVSGKVTNKLYSFKINDAMHVLLLVFA